MYKKKAYRIIKFILMKRGNSAMRNSLRSSTAPLMTILSVLDVAETSLSKFRTTSTAREDTVHRNQLPSTKNLVFHHLSFFSFLLLILFFVGMSKISVMAGLLTREMHAKISGQPQLLTLCCPLLWFQSMLFVEIPEYRNKHIRTAVKVNFYVINGKRKRSQPQHFTYHPGNSPGQSNLQPSSHKQDIIFCSVVFTPLFEDLNFTNLIQQSVAKHSITGSKGACDL